MRRSIWLTHAVIALCAAVALIAGSGCTDAGSFLDEPSTRRSAEWLTGNNFVFRCEGGTIQTYAMEADGSLTKFDGPANGEDCEPSDNDDGRANSISEMANDVFNNNLPPSPQGQKDSREASQSIFSTVPPLPFGPQFPQSDASKVTRTCSPGGQVYVVNHRSSTVTKFTLCPAARSTRITVGSNPLQAALTPDGRTLLVTRYDNSVVLIDTATDTVTTSINTGALNPNGIAISPDGALAYITNYDNSNPQVFVIDIAARSIVGTIPTSAYPKSVFLTPDGAQLWVLNYRSSIVTIIDTLSRTVATLVNVSGQADMGMAFDPSGTRAYLGVGPASLLVLDTATLDTVARIPVGFMPSDVAVTPDGSRVVVNSWSDASAAMIDTTNNQVMKTTTKPGRFSMGLVVYR